MKITIFSGGSGSVKLQQGLKKIAPHCEITNIINLYDDGKSTGIARQVCDVLGPSDLRKNHYVQYLNSDQIKNKNILEFYEKRFDIPSENPEEFVLDKLTEWDLLEFEKYVPSFFAKAKSKNINDFSDFGLANIIYGSMFAEIGVEETNVFFKEFLNLKDSVVINSFDNDLLMAVTYGGQELHDEGSIVDYNNAEDRIKEVCFTNYSDPKNSLDRLMYDNFNPQCKEVLENSDLVIFSSGTQWSSLIPTYMNEEMIEAIRNVTCPSVFIMNINEDSDMLGYSSSDVIDTVEQFIDFPEKTTFLFNEDAMDTMKVMPTNHNCVMKPMENNGGKSDPEKLAKEIFKIYFNISKTTPDAVFVDFDDTLYARSEDDVEVSIENCELYNKLAEKKSCAIVSGNSYRHLHRHLSKIFGGDVDVNFDIWADGGILKYKNNELIDWFEDFTIKQNFVPWILELLRDVKLKDKTTLRGSQELVTCINIKPLSDLERLLLTKYLNEVFSDSFQPIRAKVTGTTSVDITFQKVSKKYVLDKYDTFNHLLYVGDECDSGNDVDISQNADSYIQVKDAYDMNVVLRLLLNGDI